MDFSSVESAEKLSQQLEKLLADRSMFDFICVRSFKQYDAEQNGYVTLPQVAPMVQNLLTALNRPATSESVFAIWRKHCDPVMHQMTCEQFKPFVQALFTDFVESWSEAQKARDKAKTVEAGSSLIPPPSFDNLHAISDQAIKLSPCANRKVEVGNDLAARVETMDGYQPTRFPTEGPKTVMQDPARSPAQPKSKLVPRDPLPVEHTREAPMQNAQSSSVPPEPVVAPQPVMQKAPAPVQQLAPPDALGRRFAQLPEKVQRLVQAAKATQAAPLQTGYTDFFQNWRTIFVSLEAALFHAHALLRGTTTDYFEDAEFGPSPADPTGSKAIRRSDAPEQVVVPEGISWLRPAELNPKPSGFTGDLSALEHGSVASDAWFLGAVGVLASDERYLFGNGNGEEPLGIFPLHFWDPALRQRGLYCFRFNKYGCWHYVIIDDRLPCDGSTKQPLCAQASGGSFWAALLEKAYAKLHGGYSALWSGFVDEAFEDLTSMPTEKLATAKYAAATHTGAAPQKRGVQKDPGELWSSLVTHLASGSVLACSRVESTKSDSQFLGASTECRFVHVEGHVIGLPQEGVFNTGLVRNAAYGMLVLCDGRLKGGQKVRLVRLRDPAGTSSWRGRWGDQAEEWLSEADIMSQLRYSNAGGGRILKLRGQDNATGMTRPQIPLYDAASSPDAGGHDGSFVMLFEDWLQIFSHVFVCQPLSEQHGWTTKRLQGGWTDDRCGGTPIPVKQPVLATPESWAKNPQCCVVIGDPPVNGFDGRGSDSVEICISLQQPDARMKGGSPFPFEDRLCELFTCISLLDYKGQRLEAFDKKRILKQGGVSLISKRREVLLKSKLKAPGCYAVVPSTWETHIPSCCSPEAPFLLSLFLHCPPEFVQVEVLEKEGWKVVQ